MSVLIHEVPMPDGTKLRYTQELREQLGESWFRAWLKSKVDEALERMDSPTQPSDDEI
jgi:hypothetical protein